MGWDMWIEQLNAEIKKHCNAHVSEEQIVKFVESWSLCEQIRHEMRQMLHSERAQYDKERREKAQTDVDALKSKLRDEIGSTWTRATRTKSVPSVLEGAARGNPPWVEIQRVMDMGGNDAPHKFVGRHVCSLTPFFEWIA